MESSPEQTESEFIADSFLFLGIDKDDNIACEVLIGSKISGIKKFGHLLKKLTTNELTDVVLERIESGCESEKNGKRKYEILKNILIEEYNREDLAIDPSKVKIYEW